MKKILPVVLFLLAFVPLRAQVFGSSNGDAALGTMHITDAVVAYADVLAKDGVEGLKRLADARVYPLSEALYAAVMARNVPAVKYVLDRQEKAGGNWGSSIYKRVTAGVYFSVSLDRDVGFWPAVIPVLEAYQKHYPNGNEAYFKEIQEAFAHDLFFERSFCAEPEQASALLEHLITAKIIDPDFTDEHGMTMMARALFRAVDAPDYVPLCREAVVNVLLRNGANPRAGSPSAMKMVRDGAGTAFQREMILRRQSEMGRTIRFIKEGIKQTYKDWME